MVSQRRNARPALLAPETAPHLDTLPDVARRLRRLSMDSGCDHFAVYLFANGEARRMLPSLDSEYPGHSDRTAHLAETLGEPFIRRALDSTRPFWWTTDAGAPAAIALQRCMWAEEVGPPSVAGTALALPLSAERDESGLMVLSGERMAFTMRSLTELHARCLQLFGLIARLRPTVADAPPAMTRREIECLRLTANGHTSEEIAARLGLSVHTTTQYVANFSQKLNAMNKVHAVAKAMRLGLID
jgi:DNA-binding CsgD family transcriptional regulator